MNCDTPLKQLLDKIAIVEVVVGIASAFDSRNWDRLQSLLADELDVDYTEFRGEPPKRITADAYIKSRREGLEGLRTLHLSTNHEVRISGDRATCLSAYRIYRVNPARRPGENRLDTAGRYEHGLIRKEGAWKVVRIRQTVVVRRGNAQVHGAFRHQPSNTT